MCFIIAGIMVTVLVTGASGCHYNNTATLLVDLTAQNLAEVPQGNITCFAVELNLSRNALTTLENETLFGLSNLTVLSLSSNLLEVIQPLAFAGLTNLIELDLSGNMLTQWPEFSSACTSLATLNMNDNHLANATNEPMCLRVLKVLQINSNGFETVPDLTDVGGKLTRLQMIGNQLTNISEEDLLPLQSITNINLMYNSLTSCSFLEKLNATPQVKLRGNPFVEMEPCAFEFSGESVDFAYSKIAHVPNIGPACKEITSLSFGTSLLTSINDHAFDNCTKLGWLYLSWNYLTEFPILNGASNTLWYLNLQGSRITEIAPERLDMLVKLRYLNMESNRMATFPNVPGPSRTLTTLYLTSNQFTVFPNLTIIGTSITELYLNGNTGITSFSEQDVSPLSSLTVLHLADTSLATLPDVSILPAFLESIYLDRTLITTVSQTHMIRIADLGLLVGLSGTGTASLPTTCGVSGMSLDLRGSSMDLCSCKMLWMKLVESQIEVSILVMVVVAVAVVVVVVAAAAAVVYIYIYI